MKSEIERIQHGFRSAEDEPLFQQPISDPSVQPDRVSPSVEGYFRIPAIWVSDTPDPPPSTTLDPRDHHATMVDKCLSCGIKVRVQENGTFLFDFESWSLAPQLSIPGFRIPDPNLPYRPPMKTIAAETKAENYAALRAQVMNVHQACLATSERTVRRRSAEIGLPVTSWNTLKGISFDTAIAYRDDTEDVRALARNSLSNKFGIRREQSSARRIIEVGTIDHSLELLDSILGHEDRILIEMIEAIYIAAARASENRLGEAITLAWGVCEQLLSSAWTNLLEDKSTGNRMSKKRKQKLYSRDFTASVITEVLEMTDRIDQDLYRLLEEVRRCRNKWVHEMQSPTQDQLYSALKSAQKLARSIKGIHLDFDASSRGGVPQWTVSNLKIHKAHERQQKR